MSAFSLVFHFTICVFVLEILNIEEVYSASSLKTDVDDWMAKQPAGAVAAAVVSPNSKTEYFFSGKLNATSSELPNEHTMFEIGSITKGFTGLLLADQVLVGHVLLNDTLAKLLTNWPGRFSSAAGNVTLLELTTHTSGLSRLPANMEPANPHNPYADYSEDKLYKWLDEVELSNRSSFLYSNVGVGILGHVLAIVSGKDYEDLLKERVLNPLGLNDTVITLSDDQKIRMAPGHDENGTIESNWDLNVLAPAGALRSSIAEFVRFLRFAIGFDENKDHIDHLHKALEFAIQPRRNADRNTTIGCNWLIDKDGSLIYHPGSTGGYNSFLGWDPKEQIGIAVLASITSSNITANDLALDLLAKKVN